MTIGLNSSPGNLIRKLSKSDQWMHNTAGNGDEDFQSLFINIVTDGSSSYGELSAKAFLFVEYLSFELTERMLKISIFKNTWRMIVPKVQSNIIDLPYGYVTSIISVKGGNDEKSLSLLKENDNYFFSSDSQNLLLRDNSVPSMLQVDYRAGPDQFSDFINIGAIYTAAAFARKILRDRDAFDTDFLKGYYQEFRYA